MPSEVSSQYFLVTILFSIFHGFHLLKPQISESEKSQGDKMYLNLGGEVDTHKNC